MQAAHDKLPAKSQLTLQRLTSHQSTPSLLGDRSARSSMKVRRQNPAVLLLLASDSMSSSIIWLVKKDVRALDYQTHIQHLSWLTVRGRHVCLNTAAVSW